MTLVLKGVMQSPVTPLKADFSPDYDTFERLVDFHVRTGATAISWPHHKAESHNLTIAERKALGEVAIKAVAKRVPISIHVSALALGDTFELARHAQASGADAIIAITPYFWKYPSEAIYDYFVKLGTTFDLPLIAYNSPSYLDGVEFTGELTKRLIDKLPNFIGMKEASFNSEKFFEILRAALPLRPNFAMIAGVEYLLPSVSLGGGRLPFVGRRGLADLGHRTVQILRLRPGGARTVSAIQAVAALDAVSRPVSVIAEGGVRHHGQAGRAYAAAFADGVKRTNQIHRETASRARHPRYRAARLVTGGEDSDVQIRSRTRAVDAVRERPHRLCGLRKNSRLPYPARRRSTRAAHACRRIRQPDGRRTPATPRLRHSARRRAHPDRRACERGGHGNRSLAGRAREKSRRQRTDRHRPILLDATAAHAHRALRSDRQGGRTAVLCAEHAGRHGGRRISPPNNPLDTPPKPPPFCGPAC